MVYDFLLHHPQFLKLFTGSLLNNATGQNNGRLTFPLFSLKGLRWLMLTFGIV